MDDYQSPLSIGFATLVRSLIINSPYSPDGQRVVIQVGRELCKSSSTELYAFFSGVMELVDSDTSTDPALNNDNQTRQRTTDSNGHEMVNNNASNNCDDADASAGATDSGTMTLDQVEPTVPNNSSGNMLPAVEKRRYEELFVQLQKAFRDLDRERTQHKKNIKAAVRQLLLENKMLKIELDKISEPVQIGREG